MRLLLLLFCVRFFHALGDNNLSEINYKVCFLGGEKYHTVLVYLLVMFISQCPWIDISSLPSTFGHFGVRMCKCYVLFIYFHDELSFLKCLTNLQCLFWLAKFRHCKIDSNIKVTKALTPLPTKVGPYVFGHCPVKYQNFIMSSFVCKRAK